MILVDTVWVTQVETNYSMVQSTKTQLFNSF